MTTFRFLYHQKIMPATTITSKMAAIARIIVVLLDVAASEIGVAARVATTIGVMKLGVIVDEGEGDGVSVVVVAFTVIETALLLSEFCLNSS